MSGLRKVIALCAMLLVALVPQAQEGKILGALPSMVDAASQQQDGGTRLSPAAVALLADLEACNHRVHRRDTALIARYGLVRKGFRYYVQAFAELDHDYVDGELASLKVKPMSVQGRMLTVLIPTRRYVEVVASGHLLSIDVQRPVRPGEERGTIKIK